MILALVVGTLLAVGALGFVLQPLFFGDRGDNRRPVSPSEPAPEGEGRAIAALREIEFDRATGKLSESDYAELKARYTNEAVLEMRREAKSIDVVVPPSDDEIEAAVRAYRASRPACPECGPRPEMDAVYCSNCGRFLRDSCAVCGAAVVAPDARFCINCGTRLAA
jgi:hypothetical protein